MLTVHDNTDRRTQHLHGYNINYKDIFVNTQGTEEKQGADEAELLVGEVAGENKVLSVPFLRLDAEEIGVFTKKALKKGS